jgi:hypothetical protein
MAELMNATEISLLVVYGAIVIWLCPHAYRFGYGGAPKNVCEPVKMLSTGERFPDVNPQFDPYDARYFSPTASNCAVTSVNCTYHQPGLIIPYWGR